MLSLQAECRISLFFPKSAEAIREHMSQWPCVEVIVFLHPWDQRPLLGLLTYGGRPLAHRAADFGLTLQSGMDETALRSRRSCFLGASPPLPGCSFVLCVLLAPDNHFLFPIDFTQTLLPFSSIPGTFSSSSSHKGKSINFRIPRPAFGHWALQVRTVFCCLVAFSVNP